MKYNFDIDINNDNISTSLIIRQVKKGSTVLEFGPAAGYMTKYMKEQLNCNVYTVEIDKEAAQIASAYSVECMVGNIEDYEWLKKFNNIKFDYVIFSDVLEHLHDPWEVLKKAITLLEESGSVLVSIPNIAHNSVLIDLINNKFDYRLTGLLDKTHIRFFTYSSAIELFNYADLLAVKEMATTVEVDKTELKNSFKEVAEVTKVALDNRDFKEIYQFVFELKKEDYVKKNNIKVYTDLLKYKLSKETEKMFEDYNGTLLKYYDLESKYLVLKADFDNTLQKLNESSNALERLNVEMNRLAHRIASSFIRFLEKNSKFAGVYRLIKSIYKRFL